MARKTTPATVGEFVSSEDAERMAQMAAGRALAAYPEPEILAPELPDDSDDIALANVIADLGGPGIDAKVNVYYLDAGRNKAFARAYMPAEFSLESVQQEFGPGDYEIHVRKDGKLATRKVIKIAAPKNQPVAVAPANTGLESAKLIETMQNGFKELGAMFAGALSSLAANQAKPKTTMEMLTELKLMREVMGANVPATPPADPLQMMEMAMTLAEKIQPRVGEPGTGEVIMEAIKNFGPMLASAASQRQTVPQIPASFPAPMPGIPIKINPDESPANIGEPVLTPAGEDNQMNLMKKYYLGLLIANAQADNDPTTYAQLMLDTVGEAVATEFVNAPDWFEKLCAEEPRAVNHRGWFDEMRVCILELTKPENEAITGNSPIPPAPSDPNVS